MSTRKDHTRTLLAEFQVVVEELRTRGMTDIDVHSLINMIWQGWLVAGRPTEEYLQLATQAKDFQKRTSARIVGINGETFNSK